MAFTQTDLNNIDTAIATGELSVEVSGKRVIYRSMDDLQKAREIIKSDLLDTAVNSSAGATRRGSYRVTFTTHRGD